MSSDLDHFFSTTLTNLIEGKEAGKEFRATEADKARWLADITECLRTYDILGLWADAEEVIRTDVRKFVKKVCTWLGLFRSCHLYSHLVYRRQYILVH